MAEVIKLIDSRTSELVSYEATDVWADGTPMDDTKLDPAIYRKSGGLYYKRAITGPINVRWFGAKGDDIQDDTSNFLAAISFAKKAQHGEIYIPKGVYKITSRLYFDFDNVYLHGDGQTSSILNYYYQQADRTGTYYNEYVNSCITTSETDWVNNYRISNLGIIYKGDYDIKDPSNYYSHGFGAISGIFVPRINNLLIDSVEITGFNHVGIGFDYPLMPTGFGLSSNVRIISCNIYKNHFANILAKNVHGITLASSSLNDAGSGLPEDMVGVTGYGVSFAPYNGQMCDNIVVDGCIFKDNNRKGVDSHGCGDIVVSNTILDGNRAAQCAIIDNSGTIRIKSNIFKNHKEMAYIPERGHFSFVSLTAGCSAGIQDSGTINYSMDISGNIFRDIDINSGEIFSIVQLLTNSTNVKINFSSNIIRAKNTNWGFYVNSSSKDTTGNKIILHGNQFYYEQRVGSYAFDISNMEDITVTSNNIFVNSQGISLNNINISGFNPFYFRDINIANHVNRILIADNMVSGSKWDGVDTGDPLTQNYIPIDGISVFSGVNRNTKVILEDNWLNNIVDTDSNSRRYVNSLIGNGYVNNVSRIIQPNNSTQSYYQTLGKVGAIQIKFPKAVPSSYIRYISFSGNVCSFPGTASDTKGNFSFIFSGFIYNDGSTTSIRNAAVSITNRESTPIIHTFRTGVDTNGYPYLIIDDISSVWDRTYITIDRLSMSGTNTETDDYQSGFTVSIVTALTNITTSANIPVKEPRLLSQSAAQSDSTATDITGLVADFNAFLAKQRASGQMAT